MTRRPLCRLDEIPEPGSRGFELGGGARAVPIFVVRAAGRVAAYRNACPHTGGPLDWVTDRFLSRDKRHILCATHGALFRIEDGACLAGPCAGESLLPVPVEVANGVVTVTEPDP